MTRDAFHTLPVAVAQRIHIFIEDTRPACNEACFSFIISFLSYSDGYYILHTALEPHMDNVSIPIKDRLLVYVLDPPPFTCAPTY
jgi:hypothetical protein